ncbi:MAG: class I tRNA ligase family protein, partial [Candidatus Omnitrophica bacterium]|nr:class I tRNA ligase family protein [Candidatus Omnitrophota bacterium]
VLDLSAFYLDTLKDRLYTEPASTAKRRCAQSALYDILGTLVKALAPILVVTADEVWQLMRGAGWVSEPSVHLAPWPRLPDVDAGESEKGRWAAFRSMRDVVMKALEEQRSQGLIGSPLEARVTLLVNDERLRQLCEAHRETLAEAFVVSSVEVRANGAQASSPDERLPGLVGVTVERAPGGKCQRCWKHLMSVGSNAAHPHLCERCVRAVSNG